MRVATWNMQRGDLNVLHGPLSDVPKARLGILKELVKDCSVVFLQEAPQALFRDAKNEEKTIAGDEIRALGCDLYANSLHDSQAANLGCQCVVIAPPGITRIQDNYMSGGDGFRYPVSLHHAYNNASLVLTSAHFTSGDSAAENARQYFSSQHPFGCGINVNRDQYSWIVGADLNFDATRNSAGVFDNIVQPTSATHQSGSTLDGFFLQSSTPASRITDVQIYTNERRKLFTIDSPRPGGGVGYYAIEPRISTSERQAAKNEMVYWRISDHAPVVAEATF